MGDFKTILVGTDFSRFAGRGVAAAVSMANRFGARRVHLVHVSPAPPMVPLLDPRKKSVFDRAKKSAEQRLEELEVPKTSVWVSREVRMGAPARELARAAESVQADLLVVSRHGSSGLARFVLGSVANSLIRVSTTPVLVVGHDGPPECFERIVAAVDLSPISRSVLTNAVAVAHASAGQLGVLSVFEHPILAQDPDQLLPHYLSKDEVDSLGEEHKSEVDALVEKVPRGGLDVDVHVEAGGSAPARILHNAEESGADLIVMGTSGSNAWHRMILGSTANHVISKAPCAVLIVPPLARASVGDETTNDILVPEPGA